jgi:hypothetical protein
MWSTYYVYNLATSGLLILLLYIFTDLLIIDYFRKTKRNNARRVIFYSFIFYLINLVQLKTGGIVLPLQNENDTARSFHYVGDWFGIYDTLVIKTSYFNSFSLILNLLLYIPLIIYLAYFLNRNNLKKMILIVLITCLGMQLVKVALGGIGLIIPQGFGFVQNVLIITSILGGLIGILIFKIPKRNIITI